MIKSTLNKGFQLVFENGLEISVQFGTGNYCKNRGKSLDEIQKEGIVSSEDAEVAIYDSKGEIITATLFPDKGDGLYIGWNNADEIAEMIAIVKNYSIGM